jgi:LysM repeat protein
MKIKFKFPKLKFGKRKKLRATAVRRGLRATAADYEEMAEPNMKLSRALLIVLILHIVAVSGIIAFNAIKTREGSVTSAPAPAVSPAKSTTAPEVASSPNVEVKRAHAAAKPADNSHKIYTVAKGENPVIIAKKLKVSYDDLLSLNHIDDPRKLKIGQKLLIPNKTTKEKKSDQ